MQPPAHAERWRANHNAQAVAPRGAAELHALITRESPKRPATPARQSGRVHCGRRASRPLGNLRPAGRCDCGARSVERGVSYAYVSHVGEKCRLLCVPCAARAPAVSLAADDPAEAIRPGRTRAPCSKHEPGMAALSRAVQPIGTHGEAGRPIAPGVTGGSEWLPTWSPLRGKRPRGLTASGRPRRGNQRA